MTRIHQDDSHQANEDGYQGYQANRNDEFCSDQFLRFESCQNEPFIFIVVPLHQTEGKKGGNQTGSGKANEHQSEILLTDTDHRFLFHRSELKCSGVVGVGYPCYQVEKSWYKEQQKQEEAVSYQVYQCQTDCRVKEV
jgi:hypothetical protein